MKPELERFKKFKICPEWNHRGNNFQGLGFKKFLEDMGEAPSEQHKLTKIDESLPYGPYNCLWLNPDDPDPLAIMAHYKKYHCTRRSA